MLVCALVLGGLAMAATPGPSTARSPQAVVLVSTVGSASGAVARDVTRLGGRVVRPLRVIDGFVARLPRAAVAALRRAPGVRWVVPNRRLGLQSQYGADSGVASAVYTDVTRASKTWSFGTTGAGVTVALIDTGVNTSGDLAGQVVHAEDFTPEQNNLDTYGHGTFVAGLIDGTGAGSAGAIKGIAPDAKLVSLKIAGADGGTDVVKVLEALEWVVDFRDVYGIRVVNMSLGFQSHQPYAVDPLDFAVERVWNDGIVVVAAAGNGGSSAPAITDPGNDPLVVTAGSDSDKTTVGLSDDVVSSFSSSGPTADGVAKPDVIAPGRSVVSSRSPGSTVDVANPSSEIGDSYAKGSGTSFSTAVVSGVAALVISRTWSLTPDQVKNRLVSTARLTTTMPAASAGAGVVDAFAATMSSDLTAANAGVVPAAGGGSLQATRGPACLIDSTGTCLSDADADALSGFDESAYFSNSWAGSQWAGSQWVANLWTGSQWTGSQWVGSQWVATSGAGDWSGSQWVGSQWVGSQWVGSQWVGSQWVGSQWVGAPWMELSSP
jgi:serine protease AprX